MGNDQSTPAQGASAQNASNEDLIRLQRRRRLVQEEEARRKKKGSDSPSESDEKSHSPKGSDSGPEGKLIEMDDIKRKGRSKERSRDREKSSRSRSKSKRRKSRSRSRRRKDRRDEEDEEKAPAVMALPEIDFSERKEEKKQVVSDDEADPVDELDIFYSRRAEDVEWERGLGELRRLLCALRFLIEQKDIETDILNGCMFDKLELRELITVTLTTGARNVTEYREERHKVTQANQQRRAANEKKALVGEKHSMQPRPGSNLTALDRVVVSDDDFFDYVPTYIRKRENKAFNQQWKHWMRDQDVDFSDRESIYKQAGMLVFDPQVQLTEFEAVSYSELLRFLFLRAHPSPPSRDSGVFSSFMKAGQSAADKVAAVRKDIFKDAVTEGRDTSLPSRDDRRRSITYLTTANLNPNADQAEQDLNEMKRSMSEFEIEAHKRIVEKIRKILLLLRKTEYKPSPFRDSGHEFIHKIDNYLAVLLYRRKNSDGSYYGRSEQEIEEEKEKRLEVRKRKEAREEAVKANSSRATFWQALVHSALLEQDDADFVEFTRVGVPHNPSADKSRVFQKQLESTDEQKERRSVAYMKYYLFCVSMCILVAMGVFGLYSVWEFTATRSLQGVAEKLRLQIKNTVENTLFSASDNVFPCQRFFSGQFEQNVIDVESISFNATLNQELRLTNRIDRALVEIFQRFNVSGLYFATETGLYLGAFSLSHYPSPVYLGNVDTKGYYSYPASIIDVTVLRTLEQGADGYCMVQYSLDLNTFTRDWSTREVLFCLNESPQRFDPRYRKWYKSAVNAVLQNYHKLNNTAYFLEETGGNLAIQGARRLGELWTNSANLNPSSPTNFDVGVTFSSPIFRYNTSADQFNAASSRVLTLTPSDGDGQTVQMQLRGVVGVDLSYADLNEAFKEVQVGVTGVAFVGDLFLHPKTGAITIFDYVYSHTSTDAAIDLVRLTKTYIVDQVAKLGTSILKIPLTTLDCSTTSTSASNITLVNITQYGDRSLIITYLDPSYQLSNYEENLRLPSDWLLVIVFPVADYFAAVLSSANESIGIGMIVVFLNFLLLFYARHLIPDAHMLRARLLEDQKLVIKRTAMLEHSKPKEKRTTKQGEEEEEEKKGQGADDEDRDEEVIEKDENGMPIVKVKKKKFRRLKDVVFGRLETKWTTDTYKNAVLLCAAGIVFFIGLIALLWSTSAREAVDIISAELLKQSRDDLYDTTRRFLQESFLLNTLMLQAHLRTNASDAAARFRASTNEAPGNTIDSDTTRTLYLPSTIVTERSGRSILAYDSFMMNALTSFRKNDGQYPIANAFFAMDNGDFVGASIRVVNGVEQRFITAKDWANEHCYSTRAARGSGERDVFTDETPLIFGYNGLGTLPDISCSFDPRSLLFYQSVAANPKRLTYYSPLFLLQGVRRPVITIATPLVDNTGQFYGVFGVDVLTDYLSDIYQQMMWESSCESRYFTIQRTGELIASSVLQTTQVIGAGSRPGKFIVNATDVSDASILRTSSFLNKSSTTNGYTGISGVAIVNRQIGDPMTTTVVARSTATASFALEYGDFTESSTLLDVILVVTLPFDIFLGEFEQFSTLSFLLCLVTITMIVLSVYLSFQSFHERLAEAEAPLRAAAGPSAAVKKVEAKQRKANETRQQWEERALAELMREIRTPIQQAAAYEWNQSHQGSLTHWQAVCAEDVRDFCAGEGIRHIRDAQKGRDVLLLCALEEMPSRIPRTAYKLYVNEQYNAFMLGVVWFHIALALFEPETQDKLTIQGANFSAAMCEICFLFVEICDLVLTFFVTIKWRNLQKEEEAIKNMKEEAILSGKDANSLVIRLREKYGITLSKDMILDFIYSFVVFCVLLDWVVKFSAARSYQYFFPFRATMILLRSHSMRVTAGNFLKTLLSARNIFLLYCTNICVAAAAALVMFRNSITATGPEANYSDYIRALTTTFVFISNADNYKDVVYPAYNVSPFFMLYFMVFLIFGLWFILAMVIATFQMGFVRSAEETLLKQRLLDRTGIVAAFVLLDLDTSEQLSWSELEHFMNMLRPIIGDDDPEIKRAYSKLRKIYELNEIVQRQLEEKATEERKKNEATPKKAKRKLLAVTDATGPWKPTAFQRNSSLKRSDTIVQKKSAKVFDDEEAELAAEIERRRHLDAVEQAHAQAVASERNASGQFEEHGMTVWQFVHVVERLKWQRKLYTKDVDGISKFRQFLQLKVYEQASYRRMIALITLFHLCSIALYGIVRTTAEVYLDWTIFALFWLHVVEVCGRVFAYGLREYWFYATFHAGTENSYQQSTHRFDLILIMICVAGFMSAWFNNKGIVDYSSNSEKVEYGIVTALPIFRVFSLVDRLRRLYFTLLGILPRFADLFSILVTLIFIYGVIGVNLFAGQFTQLLQDSAPDVNFDDIRSSLQSLFQMLVGQGWSDLMYAGIRVSRNFTLAWYFISFICLATLLFVNIFIGLVLEGYNKFLVEEGLGASRRRKDGDDEEALDDEKVLEAKRATYAREKELQKGFGSNPILSQVGDRGGGSWMEGVTGTKGTSDPLMLRRQSERDLERMPDVDI